MDRFAHVYQPQRGIPQLQVDHAAILDVPSACVVHVQYIERPRQCGRGHFFDNVDRRLSEGPYPRSELLNRLELQIDICNALLLLPLRILQIIGELLKLLGQCRTPLLLIQQEYANTWWAHYVIERFQGPCYIAHNFLLEVCSLAFRYLSVDLVGDSLTVLSVVVQ